MRIVSRTAARRWLWLAAIATIPVPFFIGQPEWAPVLRLAFLSGLFAAVMIAEGGHTPVLFGMLGIAQTAIYLALFYVAARLAARALERVGSPRLRGAAVAGVVLALVVSSLFPIYRTPLSSTRMRSDVWHLFE
jgi:hypothetical protein